jgi:hypothetical protein
MPEADLPSHITTMSTLTGDDIYHCKTCGGEGETRDDLNHHTDCPNAGGDV